MFTKRQLAKNKQITRMIQYIMLLNNINIVIKLTSNQRGSRNKSIDSLIVPLHGNL